MSNILTHSLSFTKEDIAQYWITPAFLGEDMVNEMDVLTNVKGTQTLHRISTPSLITKLSSVGFSSQGSIALTNTSITVAALKAEFEQNGEAFVASWVESALAQGFNLDDVAKMSAPDFFNKIILPIVAQAIKADKVRMTWFSGAKKEAMSGTVPASNPTGTLDDDFTPYTGLMTRLMTDAVATTIPAAQITDVTNAMATDGVARVWKVTLSGMDAGTMILTINGTAYSQVFDTNINTTVTAWHTAHAATIAARHAEEQKLTVADDASAALTFTATHAGASFLAAATDAGTNGTWTVNTNTAATKQGNLASGAALLILNGLIDNITSEGLPYESQMKFYVTRTVARNYLASMKSLSASDSAYMTTIKGKKVLTYEGHQIIVKPDWDEYIATFYNSVYRHRAILTVSKNFVFATDGASDDKAIETWYNQDLEMRRYRVKYRANTMYKHASLITFSY